jgi:hypothetical protein
MPVHGYVPEFLLLFLQSFSLNSFHVGSVLQNIEGKYERYINYGKTNYKFKYYTRSSLR